MKTKTLFALGALMLVVSLSCKGKGEESQAQPQDEGKVLTQIGDVKITEKDLNAQVPDVGEIGLKEGDKQALLEGLEKLTVFYLAAKEQGLDKDPDVARRAEWARRAVFADEFLKQQTKDLQVTDADISQYYKEHEADFNKEMSLLEVGLAQPSLADSVKKLLRDGSYAAAKMLEYFGKQGLIMMNPVGYINAAALRFNLPPDAAEAVRTAKSKDILGPFDAGNGMQVLIMVLDVRKANPDMKKIEPVLKQALLAEKQQATVDSLYNFYKGKFTNNTPQNGKSEESKQ